ncbi:PepSY-associated TM helix domain-containing protein [Fluviibacterium sp. DFM31]|uniref:PepSY-associated TM helix domain-containing protein n=1 Tax=Meridianimarinicoccus marinus TaxID=3231483 RepID=A0ABV3L6M6_9RHOB
MLSRTFRTTVFKLHAWIGLNLSILMFLVLLSGSLLLYGVEIEAVLLPQMQADSTAPQTPASVGQIFASVRDAYPDVQINSITPRGGGFLADTTFAVTRWGQQINVWTDPITAEVIGTTKVNGLRSFLHAFHVSFLMKMKLGDLAVLSFSIILFGMVVTGLITYRRFWKGFFRAPAGEVGSRGWWGGVHRLIALWTAPFLIVATVSASYFLLGHFGIRPAALNPAPTMERETVLPPGLDGEMLDQVAAVASEAVGGMDITRLRMPGTKKQRFEIEGVTRHAAFEGGTALVLIDPSNLKVLGAYPASEATPGRKLARILQSLHYGTWAEGISRPLWLVFGLASSALALSGVLVFSARVAPRPQEAPKGPALRRAWRGMRPLKWLILVGLIGTVGLYTYRFTEVFAPDWTRVYSRVPKSDGELRISGPPQAGEPLSLRLRLNGKTAPAAQVTFDGKPVDSTLRPNDKGALLLATVTATEGRNRVSVILPDRPDAPLVWVIGRPID